MLLDDPSVKEHLFFWVSVLRENLFAQILPPAPPPHLVIYLSYLVW